MNLFILFILFCLLVNVKTSKSSQERTESCSDYHSYYSFMYHQCIMESREYGCLPSSTYGMKKLNCSQVLRLELSNLSDLSSSFLLQSILNLKTKSYYDIIHIKNLGIQTNNLTTSPSSLSSLSSKLSVINDQIDEILLERPWWKLSKITIQSDSSDGWNPSMKGNHRSTLHASNYRKSIIEIVLEKYPESWIPFLQYIVHSQYISETSCQNTSLVVGRKNGIHPGLGSVLKYLSQMKGRCYHSVFMAYWPIYNSFVSDEDCIGIDNKWNCAFLPLTKCTTPSVITSCRNLKCLNIESKGLIWSQAVYPATEYGNIVPDVTKHLAMECSDMVKRLDYSIEPPIFRYIPPYDSSIPHIVSDHLISRTTLFKHLFLSRPNAFYRSKIKKIIHNLRMSTIPDFSTRTKCVAVHIRREDRVVPGVNMSDYCFNFTYDLNPLHQVKRGCIDLKNTKQYGICPKYVDEDYGCSTVPFDAIRIEHVIRLIPRLLNTTIKDLVIITDDINFVQAETNRLQEIDSTYRIHTFKHIPKETNIQLSKEDATSRLYFLEQEYIRNRAGTDRGATLFASLKIVQQCSAFIGHFGSVVSELLFESMCIQHSGRYGVCPPIYDFRWGLT